LGETLVVISGFEPNPITIGDNPLSQGEIFH